MPFADFSAKYLIKDHCSNQDASDAPYVWTPRKSSDDPNDEIRTIHSQRTEGTCVFLENDRCTIHEVKPFECASLDCAKKLSWFDKTRDRIEEKWIEAGAPLGMRDE